MESGPPPGSNESAPRFAMLAEHTPGSVHTVGLWQTATGGVLLAFTVTVMLSCLVPFLAITVAIPGPMARSEPSVPTVTMAELDV